MEQKDITLNIC